MDKDKVVNYNEDLAKEEGVQYIEYTCEVHGETYTVQTHESANIEVKLPCGCVENL